MVTVTVCAFLFAQEVFVSTILTLGLHTIRKTK